MTVKAPCTGCGAITSRFIQNGPICKKCYPPLPRRKKKPVLICLDPGVKAAGVAIYEDNELSRAFLASGSGWQDTAQTAWELILDGYPFGLRGLNPELAIEIPQVYEKRKTDPNDLISLALMAGAFAGRAVEVTTYLPRIWKGQVPKHIMTRRIKKKLSPEEMTRVELPSARSLQHNVWDAVGIGQYHLRAARRISAGNTKGDD